MVHGPSCILSLSLWERHGREGHVICAPLCSTWKSYSGVFLSSAGPAKCRAATCEHGSACHDRRPCRESSDPAPALASRASSCADPPEAIAVDLPRLGSRMCDCAQFTKVEQLLAIGFRGLSLGFRLELQGRQLALPHSVEYSRSSINQQRVAADPSVAWVPTSRGLRHNSATC